MVLARVTGLACCSPAAARNAGRHRIPDHAPSGAMMCWLEPTIHNYWDGLWLAFVTGPRSATATSCRPRGVALFAAFGR
jgi:hypothetical protein